MSGPIRATMTPAPVLEAHRALGLASREGGLYLDMLSGYLEASRRPVHERAQAAALLDKRIETLPRRRRQRQAH